jgi:hypothetical protein
MDALTAPIPGSEHHDLGHVKADIVRAGNVRVARFIYPAGFRWSTDMKSVAGTDLCRHAHVGLLVRGRIEGRFGDGCTFAYTAPAVVSLEAGHDAWVVGNEDAILIQVDAEGETAARFGLPDEHRHA